MEVVYLKALLQCIYHVMERNSCNLPYFNEPSLELCNFALATGISQFDCSASRLELQIWTKISVPIE